MNDLAYESLASNVITRPTDTTAYASGDLIANSVTAGSVTPFSWGIYHRAAPIQLRKAFLRKSTVSIANAAYRLHFFNAAPTVGAGDNAAIAPALKATWIGSIDFPVANAIAFGDGAGVFALPISPLSAFPPLLIAGDTLYGLLEARAAYAPGNAETWSISLDFSRLT